MKNQKYSLFVKGVKVASNLESHEWTDIYTNKQSKPPIFATPHKKSRQMRHYKVKVKINKEGELRYYLMYRFMWMYFYFYKRLSYDFYEKQYFTCSSDAEVFIKKKAMAHRKREWKTIRTMTYKTC